MAKAAKGKEDGTTSRPARKTSAPDAADRLKADMDDRIRRRAYELWEAEGRPQGREAEHWSRAERELAEAGGATPSRGPRKNVRGTVARPSAGKKPGASAELGGTPSAAASGPGRQTRSGSKKM